MIQHDGTIRQILACICHPLSTADLRLLHCRSLTKGVVMIENMHWSQAQLARYWLRQNVQLAGAEIRSRPSSDIAQILFSLACQAKLI